MLSFFSDVLDFFGLVFDLIINFFSSIIQAMFILGNGTTVCMSVITLLPSFLSSAAVIGLTVAVICRLSLGTGGG